MHGRLTVSLRADGLRSPLREGENAIAGARGLAADGGGLCLPLLQGIFGEPLPCSDHRLEDFLGRGLRQNDLVDPDALHPDTVAGLLEARTERLGRLLLDRGELELLAVHVDEFVELIPADQAADLAKPGGELTVGLVGVLECDVKAQRVGDPPRQVGPHDHALAVGSLELLDLVLENLQSLRVERDLVDRPGPAPLEARRLLNARLVSLVEGGSDGHLIVADLVEKHVRKQEGDKEHADEDDERVLHGRMVHSEKF